MAGNLGLNSRYQTSREEPFQVFASDFDNSGSIDIVFGYYNSHRLYPYRSRNATIKQMPFLRSEFKDFDGFGKATLNDVYGKEALNNSLHYAAHTFATSYIENVGNGKFRVSPLPNMAQLSSVKSIIVKDVNMDGYSDVVLSGNTMFTEVETPRIDGSCGQVMIGNGKGGFNFIHPSESGLYLSGENPDMELINIGPERKPAIISCQNDGIIQIFVIDQNL